MLKSERGTGSARASRAVFSRPRGTHRLLGRVSVRVALKDWSARATTSATGAAALLISAFCLVNVLHVIPSLSLAHGGPSVALPLIARSLARAGVSVDVATTDDDGPGRRLDVPLARRVEVGCVTPCAPQLVTYSS